jgi:hypothetical protein
MPVAKELCGNAQVGCGTKGGTEVLVHTQRGLLQTDSSLAIVVIDIKNAFNSVDVAATQEEINEHIPSMLPWTQFNLNNPTLVYYGDSRQEICMAVRMETGVPQGHASSSLWYPVSQAPAIKATQMSYPDVHIMAIMDDITLVGSPEQALSAMWQLQEELAKIGAVMAPGKTKLYCPAGYEEDIIQLAEALEIEVVEPNEGIIVGGAPIGSSTFMSRHVNNKVSTIENQLKLMDTILMQPSGPTRAQTQTVYAIARLCCPSQLNYLLRTCPPSITQEPGKRLDGLLQHFVLKITKSLPYLRLRHSPPMAEILDRIHTSIRRGGNGIASSEQSSPAAYVGSLALCAYEMGKACPRLILQEGDNNPPLYMAEFAYLLEQLKLTPGMSLDDITPASIWQAPIEKLQNKISNVLDKARESRMDQGIPQPLASSGYAIAGAYTAQQAAIMMQALSNKNQIASAWLTSNPTIPANQMNDTAFCIAFWARNLLPLMMSRTHCICGALMDSLGEHPLCCPCTSVRNWLKNFAHKMLAASLRKIINERAANVQMRTLPFDKEPLLVHCFPMLTADEPHMDQLDPHRGLHSGKRADVGVTDLEGGKHILIDVTLVSAKSKTAIKAMGTEYIPGHAGTLAEIDKDKKYSSKFNIRDDSRAEMVFFGVDTAGGLGKEAIRFCQEIATWKGEDYKTELQRIYQQLSVTIQTQRAAQILLTRTKYSLDSAPTFPYTSGIINFEVPPPVFPDHIHDHTEDTLFNEFFTQENINSPVILSQNTPPHSLDSDLTQIQTQED